MGPGRGRGGAGAGPGGHLRRGRVLCGEGLGAPGGSPVVGRLGRRVGGSCLHVGDPCQVPPRVSPSLPSPRAPGGGFSGPRRQLRTPETGPWSPARLPSCRFRAPCPPLARPSAGTRSDPRPAWRCQDTPDTPIYSAGVGEEEAAIRGDLEKELASPVEERVLGQPDTPTRQPRLRHGVGAAEVLNVGRVQPPSPPGWALLPAFSQGLDSEPCGTSGGQEAGPPAHPAGALSVAVQPPEP